MYEIYETGLFGINGIKRFEKFLDKEIGTEYERNDNGDGFYLMIFDLSPNEVKKIRKWENQHDE